MAEHMEGADRLVCPARGLYLPSLYARGRTGGDVVSPLIIQARLPYGSLVLESMIPPLSTTPQVTTLPSNALSREIGERSEVERLSCTPILASREVIQMEPLGACENSSPESGSFAGRIDYPPTKTLYHQHQYLMRNNKCSDKIIFGGK